jgi:hypothetical protein
MHFDGRSWIIKAAGRGRTRGNWATDSFFPGLVRAAAALTSSSPSSLASLRQDGGVRSMAVRAAKKADKKCRPAATR